MTNEQHLTVKQARAKMMEAQQPLHQLAADIRFKQPALWDAVTTAIGTGNQAIWQLSHLGGIQEAGEADIFARFAEEARG